MKKMIGVVVSHKSSGTAMVEIRTLRPAGKYLKRVVFRRKHCVDVGGSEVKVGDSVVIESLGRRVSKRKSHKISCVL